MSHEMSAMARRPAFPRSGPRSPCCSVLGTAVAMASRAPAHGAAAGPPAIAVRLADADVCEGDAAFLAAMVRGDVRAADDAHASASNGNGNGRGGSGGSGGHHGDIADARHRERNTNRK